MCLEQLARWPAALVVVRADAALGAAVVRAAAVFGAVVVRAVAGHGAVVRGDRRTPGLPITKTHASAASAAAAAAAAAAASSLVECASELAAACPARRRWVTCQCEFVSLVMSS